MLHKFVPALVVLAIASGSLLAGELRGTVKSVDPTKSMVTVVMPDQQERTVEVRRSAPVFGAVTVGKRRRTSVQMQQVGTGPMPLQPGMMITMVTEQREGMEVATSITEDNMTFSSGGRGRRRR